MTDQRDSPTSNFTTSRPVAVLMVFLVLANVFVFAFFESKGLFGVGETPEESFQNIVRQLGLDCDLTGWGRYSDRIGKQFVPVFVNLFNHAFVIFTVRLYFIAKLFYLFFDTFQKQTG